MHNSFKMLYRKRKEIFEWKEHRTIIAKKNKIKRHTNQLYKKFRVIFVIFSMKKTMRFNWR